MLVRTGAGASDIAVLPARGRRSVRSPSTAAGVLSKIPPGPSVAYLAIRPVSGWFEFFDGTGAVQEAEDWRSVSRSAASLGSGCGAGLGAV